MKRSIAALLIVATAIALTRVGEARAEGLPFPPQKVLPVDDAPRDPSFLRFRETLRAAVARRDVKFLLSIVDPEIKLSFGDDDGLERFKEMWQPEKPESKIWRELGEVLRLGGTFGYEQDSSHTFWAPYVFGGFKNTDSLDAYGAMVVIGEEVRVRSLPSVQAPVIAIVSQEVVFTVTETLKDGEKPDDPKFSKVPPWAHVTISSGRTGYIWRKHLRSPIDYRAASPSATASGSLGSL